MESGNTSQNNCQNKVVEKTKTKLKVQSFKNNMNRLIWVRTCTSLVRRNMSMPVGPPGPTPTSAAGSSNINMAPRFRPSDFQKFILVWTKKYKSKDEIPDFVSPDVIEKSRSQARIKIANVMMLLTALASLGAIFSGKAAAKRGESIHQINQDFHKQYRDDYDKNHPEAKK